MEVATDDALENRQCSRNKSSSARKLSQRNRKATSKRVFYDGRQDGRRSGRAAFSARRSTFNPATRLASRRRHIWVALCLSLPPSPGFPCPFVIYGDGALSPPPYSTGLSRSPLDMRRCTTTIAVQAAPAIIKSLCVRRSNFNRF